MPVPSPPLSHRQRRARSAGGRPGRGHRGREAPGPAVRDPRLGGAARPRTGTDRLDLKITNAALREMRAAFRVFAPYQRRPQGDDLRLGPHAARRPAVRAGPRASLSAMADEGWMVITGAGPGIMQAGMEGAGPGQVDRRQHPASVRDRRQRDHRRRPEAGVDEVLLHPQAHADEGVEGLRLAARRVRHPRRGLRAADPAADGQGRPGADRAARLPGRPLLGGMGAMGAGPRRLQGSDLPGGSRPRAHHRRRDRSSRRGDRVLAQLPLDSLVGGTSDHPAAGANRPTTRWPC